MACYKSDFVANIASRLYKSYSELESSIREYEDKWFISFVIRGSLKDKIHPMLRVKKVVFECSFHRPRASRSTGERTVLVGHFFNLKFSVPRPQTTEHDSS